MADAGMKLFMLSVCLNLLPSPGSLAGSSGEPNKYSFQVCACIECPGYDVILSIVTICWWGLPPLRFWIFSLIKATGAGFCQLIDYIQGKNEYSKKIELTAPGWYRTPSVKKRPPWELV